LRGNPDRVPGGYGLPVNTKSAAASIHVFIFFFLVETIPALIYSQNFETDMLLSFVLSVMKEKSIKKIFNH